MERFLERHADHVLGVLCGFDRLLFRGTLRRLSYVSGLECFLSRHKVLFKDFGAWAERMSQRLKEHAHRIAKEQGRPVRYVASSTSSKEELAQEIMQRDQITQGLVCVLTCVEPCQTYNLRRDRQSKRLQLVPGQRKCLHLYFYYVDREFGLMHVRLQTWLPFTLDVCLNGREYLARRMQRAGMGYQQRENCFTRIDDLPRAQQMLDDLLHRKWHRFLDRLAQRVNPWLDAHNGLDLEGYYWTLRQGEVATDVMFRSPQDLQDIYPALVQHALTQFSCQDVLRFLGRRTKGNFSGEISSDLQSRPEGLRVKHWVEENSIKMYDKQGSVLRIETTINNPRRFRVYREATRQGESCLAWQPLRKGIADLARRVEISRAANERYLEALSVVGRPAPTSNVLDPVSRRVVRAGRPYRALRPLTPEEAAVFRSVLRGEHLVQGFRHVDLRQDLFPTATEEHVRRQAAGRTTRWLRLLRAHGLIKKVPRTNYYRVTDKGHHTMSTALRLRDLDITALAA